MATAAEVKEDPKLERVKRIIRGMLERTQENGCTLEEAELNAAKVSELMEQYELSMDEITLREKTSMVTSEVYAADRDAGSIVVGIGRLCSLVVYHKSGDSTTTYVLFGHAHDIELALFLFAVVVEALDYEWAQLLTRQKFSKAARVEFRQGFAGRICDRLTDLRDQRDAERRARVQMSGCTDLVVLKDQLVVAEFEKEGIRLRKTTRVVRKTSNYYRGAEAANKVNLNNPIENARKGEGRLR